MEENKRNLLDEEAKASLDIWRYLFGFADMAAAKCAIDLKVPEALENHPSSRPMTLAELSSATSASPSHLHRIMRFLVYQGVFKEVSTKDGLATGYTNTPLSRRMMITKRDGKSLAPLLLLETSPEMLAPWLKLSSVVSSPVNGPVPPFDAVHGKDLWSFAKDHPRHSELLNEAMACDARRVVPRVAGACQGLFDGVATVVDVGGGTGETIGILVKEFPGKELWSFAKDNPRHSELINEAMACEARRVVPLVAGACHGLFDGVAMVVDVGGGTGDTMAILVKEFPWIKGINFDLPHVVEVVQAMDNVDNVGGDMFDSIPSCDAVFIKWVLHDWGDKDCIKILKNCKKALPPKTGKVLIVESVVGEKKKTMIMEERDEKLEYVKLALDMVMMVHTSTGKERTLKEWDFVIKEAGFARYEVRDIDDVQSVIIAYRS
uniref:O-methyltransferase domain-containing protein n=1 Tax=Brassica oleracea var. oleracea TaxID=109376 RepID=A0A0D3DM21_BRAOL